MQKTTPLAALREHAKSESSASNLAWLSAKKKKKKKKKKEEEEEEEENEE